MPDGSTLDANPAIPGIEIWHIPLDPATAVDYVRPQLPTGPYKGMPACPVDVTQNKFESTPITSWLWENTAGDNLQVSAQTWAPTMGTEPGSELTTTTTPETTPEPC
jgi:hypothetical protein